MKRTFCIPLVMIISIIIWGFSCKQNTKTPLNSSTSLKTDSLVSKGSEGSQNKPIYSNPVFSIHFPDNPKQKTSTVPFRNTQVKSIAYTVEVSPKLVYSVEYSDYPAEWIKQTGVNNLLKGAKDYVVDFFYLKTEKEKLNAADNSLYFEGKSENFVVYYLFRLHNNRLFQVSVLSDKPIEEKAVQEYFSSFKIK